MISRTRAPDASGSMEEDHILSDAETFETFATHYGNVLQKHKRKIRRHVISNPPRRSLRLLEKMLKQEQQQQTPPVNPRKKLRRPYSAISESDPQELIPVMSLSGLKTRRNYELMGTGEYTPAPIKSRRSATASHVGDDDEIEPVDGQFEVKTEPLFGEQSSVPSIIQIKQDFLKNLVRSRTPQSNLGTSNDEQSGDGASNDGTPAKRRSEDDGKSNYRRSDEYARSSSERRSNERLSSSSHPEDSGVATTDDSDNIQDDSDNIQEEEDPQEDACFDATEDDAGNYGNQGDICSCIGPEMEGLISHQDDNFNVIHEGICAIPLEEAPEDQQNVPTDQRSVLCHDESGVVTALIPYGVVEEIENAVAHPDQTRGECGSTDQTSVMYQDEGHVVGVITPHEDQQYVSTNQSVDLCHDERGVARAPIPYEENVASHPDHSRGECDSINQSSDLCHGESGVASAPIQFGETVASHPTDSRGECVQNSDLSQDGTCTMSAPIPLGENVASHPADSGGECDSSNQSSDLSQDGTSTMSVPTPFGVIVASHPADSGGECGSPNQTSDLSQDGASTMSALISFRKNFPSHLDLSRGECGSTNRSSVLSHDETSTMSALIPQGAVEEAENEHSHPDQGFIPISPLPEVEEIEDEDPAPCLDEEMTVFEPVQIRIEEISNDGSIPMVIDGEGNEEQRSEYGFSPKYVYYPPYQTFTPADNISAPEMQAMGLDPQLQQHQRMFRQERETPMMPQHSASQHTAEPVFHPMFAMPPVYNCWLDANLQPLVQFQNTFIRQGAFAVKYGGQTTILTGMLHFNSEYESCLFESHFTQPPANQCHQNQGTPQPEFPCDQAESGFQAEAEVDEQEEKAEFVNLKQRETEREMQREMQRETPHQVPLEDNDVIEITDSESSEEEDNDHDSTSHIRPARSAHSARAPHPPIRRTRQRPGNSKFSAKKKKHLLHNRRQRRGFANTVNSSRPSTSRNSMGSEGIRLRTDLTTNATPFEENRERQLEKSNRVFVYEIHFRNDCNLAYVVHDSVDFVCPHSNFLRAYVRFMLGLSRAKEEPKIVEIDG